MIPIVISVHGKGAERVKNWRINRDFPNHDITKIGQNTEKSPGDLGGLAVTHSPVRNHQLTMQETLYFLRLCR